MVRQISHDENSSIEAMYNRLADIQNQSPRSQAAIKAQAIRAEHYKGLIAQAETRRNVNLARSAWVNQNGARLQPAELAAHSHAAMVAARGTPQAAAREALHQRVMSSEFPQTTVGVVRYLGEVHDLENPPRFVPSHAKGTTAGKKVRYH